MTGTTEKQFRAEEDALGDVQVPAERLWGAQTQRSYMNFQIGSERFRWGRPVIRAQGNPGENVRPSRMESWDSFPNKKSTSSFVRHRK